MQDWIGAIAALVMLASPAQATAGHVHESKDCRALFGSQARHAQNKDMRQARLIRVEDVAKSTVVSHAYARWKTPSVLRVKDVDLVEVQPQQGDKPAQLTVRVGESFQDYCEPGLYRVGVDDALGNEGQIIATTKEAALVQEKDALYAWVPEGKKPPTNWRMVWRAGYEISLEQKSAAKKTPLKTAAQRRKERAKKNRSKTKKKSSRSKRKGRKR